MGKSINDHEQGRTALHAACVTNSMDAAYLLLSAGIDVNLRDKETGATALHYCATYNYFDLARKIIEHGGDLSVEDDYGNQPLWTAVFNVRGDLQKLAIVELFLKSGAQKNNKNKAGRSPVDFANQVKDLVLIEMLDSY